MSLRSMTAYAREVFSVGEKDFSVEISSVNQRGLAVSIYAPQEWSGADRLLMPLVREVVSRGKVSVTIRAGTHAEAACDAFTWDEAATAKALSQMVTAAKNAGVDFVPTADTYLRLAEFHRVRRDAHITLEDESVSGRVCDAVSAALKSFVAMREIEGANLEKDFRERLSRLREWAGKIREASAGTVAAYREALRSRLAVLGLEIDLDDARVLKELSLFADRSDIAEELTRLDSHFAQFETTLAERECGRKLDFICQEILREFNTIGSKANNVAITRCVVEAKNEQERLREQVQNIE